MNIVEYLRSVSQAKGNAQALFHGEQCVANYAEFEERVGRVAGWLNGRGIAPGDRVAIFMKNGPEYLVVQYGIWAAGAVAVPINAKLHGREASWIIEDVGAQLVFVSPGLDQVLLDADAAEDVICITSDTYRDIAKAPVFALAPRTADDLCWLFYTSGTTGRPKGVMITHGMLQAMALSYFADVDAVSSMDAALYAAPMSHGAGIYNIMHVIKGARHVFPSSGGFDEAEIFDLARHFGRVHMFAAPTMVKRMTEVAKLSGQSGEGLRTVVYGGGPMYVADIIEAVDHFGPIFVQIYGQGECPMAITALSRDAVADRSRSGWQRRLGSVGRAQSVVEVLIGDGHRGEAARGTPGEIMVRGATVMPGYWRNPEATEKTVVDGWLLTGDVGVMDEEGYITLHDRSKDMIISGGSNIYPREVEEVLLTHADVAEVSVVGRPHEEWGEDVVAFVVMSPGAKLDQGALDHHCVENIARFKRPKAYFQLDTLPKNNYGKVLKTELRTLLKEIGNG